MKLPSLLQGRKPLQSSPALETYMGQLAHRTEDKRKGCSCSFHPDQERPGCRVEENLNK